MTSKRWLITFIGTVLLVAVLIAGFNVATDPFGVFGDRLMDWYSANETNNPRVAKIAYLDRHHQEYDSYIIGSSSTSSLSVEKLNDYMDARFYNLFMYGADMYDVRRTAEYVVQNYEVKNLVLNLAMMNAVNYEYENDPFTDNLHAKTEGASTGKFYLKYLFANPAYGFSKLKNRAQDTWLSQPFDVFDVETGSYDKRKRDVEPIGSLEDYLAANPAFASYTHRTYGLVQTENCLKDVAFIKDLCQEKGIDFTLVFSPLSGLQYPDFNPDQVAELWRGLAEISDFWDFSFSSVSTDPRYFYDATHFRNAVGDMALAKMFDDSSVYVPRDFGVLVTRENVEERIEFFHGELEQAKNIAKEVPVLMFHHISNEAEGDEILTTSVFEGHIRALTKAGYEGISLDQLLDYVERGIELPEKPVLITFDDGYKSNYQLAFPILEKYNMKAVIFAIGVSVGKTHYKDTDHEMIPHFSYEEAKLMTDSGLIEVQSHTYDMHQYAPYEEGEAREGILQKPGEGEEAYMEALREDFALSRSLLEEATGRQVMALAYPYGKYTPLAAAVLAELGVKITFSIDSGVSTVVKGLPQSLFGMKRYNVTRAVKTDELLNLLKGM